MMKMRTVEDDYQVALKEEEKLERNQIQWNIGKIPNRGRGIVIEKLQKPRGETRRYNSQT
jgi:hypothetical protein